MMRVERVQIFLAQARQCSMVMLENSKYMGDELSNVGLPKGLEPEAKEVCGFLSATKHDVFHEIFELEEMLEVDAPNEKAIMARVQRVTDWLKEPILKLHDLVKRLEEANDKDQDYQLSYALFAESGVNVMNAYNSTAQAAESIERDE